MAKIKLFCAIRYSKGIVTDFICPPYDAISPNEKSRLQKLSPFKMVNIELPNHREGKNKYKNVAELFQL